jgi:putative transcriptional regulator
LAIDACLDEGEVPEGWYQIDAHLGEQPDTSDFRYQPEEPKDDEEEEEEEKLEIPSFDIEDLTDEEELELEKHKRNIINAIIQGSAKRGHYLFQKPAVKARLDAIDPSLYRDYLGIMAINDFMYFTMEQMIEMMSQTGQGVAGKVSLDDADDEGEEGGEEGEGEEQPDTKIVAVGLIFPILCHEIIKGLEEAKGRYGHSKNPEIRQKVRGAVDVLSNEPMQLRIGPEIVEKLRYALPDEMYDESNKGLTPWFHILLYQIPAESFLKIIGNAISEDQSKVKIATSKFKEIMKEAIQMKEELFADLVESIKQAGRIMQDAKRAARQSVIGAPDVQQIRGSLGLSQKQFALLIGVSPRTVQNWEQKRREPEGAAKALLMVTALHPRVVLEALHAA